MFLWVRLVIFTLVDLYFESDVHEAIETLPEDIEAVYMRPLYNFSHIVLIWISRYERILLRLCGDGKTPNQRIAIRILQWMVVACRPLKRSELESGIILHDQVPKITTSSRPKDDVLSLCYPILEAEDDAGSSVQFIHFTAQESVLARCFGMLNLADISGTYGKPTSALHCSPKKPSSLYRYRASFTCNLASISSILE